MVSCFISHNSDIQLIMRTIITIVTWVGFRGKVCVCPWVMTGETAVVGTMLITCISLYSVGHTRSPLSVVNIVFVARTILVVISH